MIDAATQERINRRLTAELGSVIGKALNDDDVTEVMCNPDGTIWLERGGKMMKEGEVSLSHLKQAIGTIATTLDTTVTREKPFLQGDLPLNGERVWASVPPVSSAPAMVIRKHAKRTMTLEDWVSGGSMTEQQAERLVELVQQRKNIVIAGGTGSGKTSLLNALLIEVQKHAPDGRVVVLEDTRELKTALLNNVVALCTAGNYTILDLVRQAMRMRPDRIVVGEVRGAEAFDMLKAWNTGHPGGIATIHADSLENIKLRLVQLCAESISSDPLIEATVSASVDEMVLIAREGAHRRLVGLSGIDGE